MRRAGATPHRGARASHYRGLSLRSTGSRCAGSVVAVAHGLSCSAACGIFPDQGSNPCSLHRQADSQPLRHQGSPNPGFFLMPRMLFLFFFFSFLNVLHGNQFWLKHLCDGKETAGVPFSPAELFICWGVYAFLF